MTLDEWVTYIETHPILTDEDIKDLKRAFYIDGWIDAVKLSKLIAIDSSIDYINSSPKLQDLLIWIIVDYLLNDDEESETTGIYDVITKSEGDGILREIDKLNISTEVRTNLLLKINERANIIESTKLITAINEVL